jgi:phospholipid N-methyltransferase
MSQLSLWDDPVHPSSSTVAKNSSEQAPRKDSEKANKAAHRCRSSADAMQKHIDAKHHSANNMLAQPPTRKRLRDADGLRKQAIRLERIQATLRRLAEMHMNGSIAPDLAGLTTKGALENALFTSPGDSAIYLLYNSVSRDERSSERVLRLISEAATMGIPGYFPTPKPLAERLVEMACIEPGNRVLEPSAGTGNLIDAILKNHQGVRISYCELNCFLLDILSSKYEGVNGVSFLGRDYFDVDTNRVENRFDRIIMNPPFESGQDVDHVLRAWYSLLAPKGILTGVVSAGVFSRTDKKAKSFREFLQNAKAVVHDVPAGSFKSSGTGVESKIVLVRACG